MKNEKCKTQNGMRRPFWWAVIAAMWVVLALLMSGAVYAEGALTGEALEKKALEIDTMLMAPCCWTQPISKHYSSVAMEMREGVRRMLAEGKTQQEVLDFYVAKYGKRILSMPPAQGFDLMAYVSPVLFLALGGWGLVAVIRRLKRGRPAERPEATPVSAFKDAYAERLERELRERE